MGKKEETKTFNDLAERFQWTEALDPDHIFAEEKEMIKELREGIPELEKETDKFVAVFLFSRRHELKDVKELLQAYYKKKAELNIEDIPSLRHTPVLRDTPDLGGVPQVNFKGFRDVHDRMLRVFWLGREDSSKRSLEYTYIFWYFQLYYMLDTEPLNSWRNGICLLVDLKGFGWRNLDMSSKGRESNRAMQGLFPFRIRAIYAFNGGSFLSALVQACKFVLPKKLMSRVHLIDIAELKSIVEPQYLLKEHGGESEYTMKDFEIELLETENELFAKGLRQDPPERDGADVGANDEVCCDGEKVSSKRNRKKKGKQVKHPSL